MSWIPGFVLELPKIGIKVKEHVSTGWGEIVPRTFGYSGFTLVPSYDEGGFDIFAVQYQWSLDWNPQGLYDSSGRCDTGDCSNFYNFDVNEDKSSVASDINNYLNELDFDSRILKAKEVQKSLFENIPVIPMFYPRSHWGLNEELNGIDTLLLSISAQDWALVSKENFVSNTPNQSSDPSLDDGSNENLVLPIDKKISLGTLIIIGLISYGLYFRDKRLLHIIRWFNRDIR